MNWPNWEGEVKYIRRIEGRRVSEKWNFILIKLRNSKIVNSLVKSKCQTCNKLVISINNI